MRYLLYNPLSGKGNQAKEDAEHYAASADMPSKMVNMTEIASISDFFDALAPSDDVVIFGGDGSLNKLVNALDGRAVEQEIYYFPCGTGNDFARDIGEEKTRDPIPVSGYLRNLPTVTVNGVKSKFLNGVGFGIDGYCCEVGDELKRQHKSPNYTAIAIKGLFFHFKPVRATVTVDGETSAFKKVWIAPTMFGRYYGGGMMPTPHQDRTAPSRTVSVMLFHNMGKLKTLSIFPSLFKGEHVKHKKNVAILEGKHITVTFSHPASLQIDGETVLNVTTYTVETE